MCRTTNQQERSETYYHSNWGRILWYRGHCGRRGRRWLCNYNNILQITELLSLNRRKRCNIRLLSQCLNGRQEVSTLNLLREVACNLLLKSTHYVIARIAGDTRLNNWYFTLNCGLWGVADGSDSDKAWLTVKLDEKVELMICWNLEMRSSWVVNFLERSARDLEFEKEIYPVVVMTVSAKNVVPCEP